MQKIAIQSNRDSYLIRFSINAQCEAEQMLGFPVTQLSQNNAGINVFRTLFYVGLKDGGNSKTLEQAGEIMGQIIEDKGMEYFSGQIGEALNKSFAQQNSQNYKQQHTKKKR